MSTTPARRDNRPIRGKDQGPEISNSVDLYTDRVDRSPKRHRENTIFCCCASQNRQHTPQHPPRGEKSARGIKADGGEMGDIVRFEFDEAKFRRNLPWQ